MAAQYPPMMPHLGAYYPSGYPPMMPPPPPDFFQPRLHQLHTLSMENLGSYSDLDDPGALISPQQGSSRSRRRQGLGSDHVKHRRTRSGCYTCRQRRVKCDETQPVCDRCRKGKRECTYPGTSSTAKTGRRDSKSKSTSADSGSSPSADEDDEDEKNVLPSIPDDEEDLDLQESTPTSATTDSRTLPDSSAVSTEKSTPQSTESASQSRRPSRPQAVRTSSKHSAKSSISQSSRWHSLPDDVKMYLRYHKDRLTHHHYAFKYDAGNFFKTTFLEIAMNDPSQALLYAIVAFSAYHHTVEQEDPKISTFLSYYNRSIVLLQQSLKSKKPGITTLLTILQLATIEEFLGDWVNLLGHQRAAHQILITLFTPQTITQDETRRHIHTWYNRFDLFAGMMSGGETQLGREWMAEVQAHHRRQTTDRPNDLKAKLEDFFATSRLLATDVTLLFAAKKKQAVSDADFDRNTRELIRQYADFGHKVENEYTDPAYYVKSFPKAPPPSEDDITDYRDPNFFYSGELFTMNYTIADFWSIDLMFKYQLAVTRGQQPPMEVVKVALNICKMFEAMQYYDQSPPGAILSSQASMGMASLFLPKDKKHTDWCRRKLVLVEQHGYIYPPAFRKRMSSVWGVDINHWWLPNDEGYPDTVRAIRDFIEYRAQVPRDVMDAQVRDMSNIFRTLKVDDQDGEMTDVDRFSPILSDSSPDQPG